MPPATARHLAAALGLVTASCAATSDTTTVRAPVTTPRPTFFHTAFGAGPLLYTGGDGHLIEERRYEPFGQSIDAADVVARDLGEMNRRTEPATGWTDHGARWLASTTARWTAPDPLVMGPAAAQMAAPWQLHPYQYAAQNPVMYWDPDGRSPATVELDAFNLAVSAASLNHLDEAASRSYQNGSLTAAPAPTPTRTLPPPVAMALGAEEFERRTYEGMTRYASLQPGGGLLAWVFGGTGGATLDYTVGVQAEATAFARGYGGTIGINKQAFIGPGGGAMRDYVTKSTDISGTIGASVSFGINLGFKVTSFDEWHVRNGYADRNIGGSGGADQWSGVFHQASAGAGPISYGGYIGKDWTSSNQWMGMSLELGVGVPEASVQVGDVDYQEIK